MSDIEMFVSELRDLFEYGSSNSDVIQYLENWQAARESEGGEAVAESFKETLHNIAQGLENLKRNSTDPYDFNYIRAMLKDVEMLLTTISAEQESK